MTAWKAGVSKYFRDCMAKTRQGEGSTAGTQGRSSGGRERKKKKKGFREQDDSVVADGLLKGTCLGSNKPWYSRVAKFLYSK